MCGCWVLIRWNASAGNKDRFGPTGLARSARACNHGAVSVASGPETGVASAGTADAAWRAVRDAGDIQFAPVPPEPPPVTPEWIKALGRFLQNLLEPLGSLLGKSWSTVEMLLLVAAVLGALWIAWALLWPVWQARKARITVAAPEWTPAREEALALLEDADRLAALGRFDEAAHLLLRRSVGQIAKARPGWLTPSSTAREIGAIRELPHAAQAAFALIAGLVERARYALRGLDAADWAQARDAYARFALERLERVP